MRLPIALATLALATTTALPAFAAAPAPISPSLRDAAATPIETVQYRQTTPRQRRAVRANRGAYRAYAAAPRVYRRGYTPWGHCVRGLDRSARSAFPSWDQC
jgi:hypothetical protein